jgi:hypothetical protein
MSEEQLVVSWIRALLSFADGNKGNGDWFKKGKPSFKL